MLRTLMQNIVRKARAHVRFLPFAITAIVVFFIPFALYSGHLVVMQAHAGIGSSIVNYIINSLAWIVAQVLWILFKIVTLIFIFVAWLFDFAMDYSTRGSTYANMSFIMTGWTFIRDLVNSCFIFAVLLVAFKQLFETNPLNTASTQKTLVRLIIAAVLINFSLFFTKVAIDASNFLTRAIYYRMQTVSSDGVHYGPAHALAQGLDLVTIIKQDSGDTPNGLNQLIIYGGGIIMTLIATVVFFAAAFLFIARIFVLMIVLMTSPLLFASMVVDFPAVKKLRSQWVSALQGQATFPVIYMLIIYLAVRFVRSDSFSLKGQNVSLAKAFGSNDFKSMVLIVNFIIVTALMVYALKAAKDAAGQANLVGGFIQQKTLNLTGAVGRQTLGRMGKATANSKWAKEMATSNRAGMRFVGDKLMRGSNKMAESSWDVRSNRIAQMAAGQAGVNLGKGVDKSFAANGRTFSQMGTSARQWQQQLLNKNIKDVSLYDAAGNKLTGAALAAAEKQNAQNAKDRTAQAKYNLGQLEAYKDDPEAYAARAAAIAPDFFTSKDYKDARKTYVEAMQKKHESDPKKLAAALGTTLGAHGLGSEDEYKEVRVKLIEDLRKDKDYKKNPEDLDKAMRSTFGGAYTDPKNKQMSEIRIEIGKDIAGVNAGKSADTIKEKATAIGENKAAVEKLEQVNVKTPEHLAQIKEFKQKIQKDEEDKEKAITELRENLQKMRPGKILDFDAKSIAAIQGELNVGNINELNKAMAEGQFTSSDDIATINEAMVNLLQTGTNEQSRAVANNAAKYDSGFNLNLNTLLEQALPQIALAAKVSDEAKKEALRSAKAMVKGMKERELKLVDPGTLLHHDLVTEFTPATLADHYRSAVATGNGEKQVAMAGLADKIRKQDSSLPDHLKNLKPDKREALAKALTGEIPSGGGTRNRGKGK